MKEKQSGTLNKSKIRILSGGILCTDQNLCKNRAYPLFFVRLALLLLINPSAKLIFSDTMTQKKIFLPFTLGSQVS